VRHLIVQAQSSGCSYFNILLISIPSFLAFDLSTSTDFTLLLCSQIIGLGFILHSRTGMTGMEFDLVHPSSAGEAGMKPYHPEGLVYTSRRSSRSRNRNRAKLIPFAFSNTPKTSVATIFNPDNPEKTIKRLDKRLDMWFEDFLESR